MKWILVILNAAAGVVMFGSLALVPYVELTGLRTEALQMERANVIEPERLDLYLRQHDALEGRLDRYDAFARHLYGLAPMARPFLGGACFAFLGNAVLLGVFWRSPGRKKGRSSNNVSDATSEPAPNADSSSHQD